MDYVLSYTHDIAYEILMHLDVKDINSLGKVNKTTNNLIKTANAYFWKRKCTLDFTKPGDNINHKRVYYYIYYKYFYELLVYSAKHGNDNLVKYAIEQAKYENIINRDWSNALSKAVKYGHYSTVNIILEYGTIIYDGEGPMMLAIIYNHLHILQLLYRSFLSINPSTTKDLIRYAAIYGRFEIAQWLLSLGLDDEFKSLSQALCLAAFYGRFAIIKLFIDNKINVHYDNDLPFILASKNGHIMIVKELLKYNVDIHAHNGSALIGAITNGHFDIANALRNHGAYIKEWKIEPYTCKPLERLFGLSKGVQYFDDSLFLAVKDDNITIIKDLLNTRLYNNDIKNEALRLATGYGRIDVVKELLNHGADIHAEQDQALCLASEHGHFILVNELLDIGAYISTQDDKALFNAIINNHALIEKELLRRGANSNAVLQWAAADRNIDIMRSLLYIYTNTRSFSSDTYIYKALLRATYNNNPDIVKLLFDEYINLYTCPADIQAIKDQALCTAASRGFYEIVEILIKNGANVHVNDDKALQYAIENDEQMAIGILCKYGANLSAILQRTHKDNQAKVWNILIQVGAYDPDLMDLFLFFAIDGNYLDFIEELIDNNADIHANNNYILYHVINNNKIDMVQYLLSIGVNFHIDNNAILLLLFKQENYEIIRLILNHDVINKQ